MSITIFHQTALPVIQKFNISMDSLTRVTFIQPEMKPLGLKISASIVQAIFLSSNLQVERMGLLCGVNTVIHFVQQKQLVHITGSLTT